MAMFLALAIVLLANVPGNWPETIWDRSRFEHGWPAVFLVRDVVMQDSRLHPWDFWNLTAHVTEFRPLALAVDVLAGLAIVAGTGWLLRRWLRRPRKRDGRRFQFTLAGTLVMLSVAGVLLAVAISQWRLVQYAGQTRSTDPHNFCLPVVTCLPDWSVYWAPGNDLLELPPYCPFLLDYNPPRTDQALKTIQHIAHRYPRHTLLHIERPLSSAQAQRVQQLTDIQSLAILEAGDANLRALAPLEAVRNVYLVSNHRTASRRTDGDVLQHLRHMSQMEKLFIFGEPLDDAALATLENMPRLEELHHTFRSGRHLGFDIDSIHVSERLYPLPINPWDVVVEKRITDAGLAHLAGHSRLHQLRLEGTQIRGPGLAHLAALPRLRHLSLESAPLTDEALKYLSGCTSLTTLDLTNTDVLTLSGLDWASLPNLRRIDLFGTTMSRSSLEELRGQHPGVEFVHAFFDRTEALRQWPRGRLRTGSRVTAEHLAEIANLPGLTHLDMSHSNVDDQGLACIFAHADLTFLWLTCTQIGDVGMEHLKHTPELDYLDLGGTRVSDAGIELLADIFDPKKRAPPPPDPGYLGPPYTPRIQSLRELTLEHTAVTDAGLQHVGKLTELTELWLHATGISKAGLGHLQGLINLRTLTLDASLIDPQTVAQLGKLPRLTHVTVYYTAEQYDSGNVNLQHLEMLETALGPGGRLSLVKE